MDNMRKKVAPADELSLRVLLFYFYGDLAYKTPAKTLPRESDTLFFIAQHIKSMSDLADVVEILYAMRNESPLRKLLAALGDDQIRAIFDASSHTSYRLVFMNDASHGFLIRRLIELKCPNKHIASFVSYVCLHRNMAEPLISSLGGIPFLKIITGEAENFHKIFVTMNQTLQEQYIQQMGGAEFIAGLIQHNTQNFRSVFGCLKETLQTKYFEQLGGQTYLEQLDISSPTEPWHGSSSEQQKQKMVWDSCKFAQVFKDIALSQQVLQTIITSKGGIKSLAAIISNTADLANVLARLDSAQHQELLNNLPSNIANNKEDFNRVLRRLDHALWSQFFEIPSIKNYLDNQFTFPDLITALDPEGVNRPLLEWWHIHKNIATALEDPQNFAMLPKTPTTYRLELAEYAGGEEALASRVRTGRQLKALSAFHHQWACALLQQKKSNLGDLANFMHTTKDFYCIMELLEEEAERSTFLQQCGEVANLVRLIHTAEDYHDIAKFLTEEQSLSLLKEFGGIEKLSELIHTPSDFFHAAFHLSSDQRKQLEETVGIEQLISWVQDDHDPERQNSKYILDVATDTTRQTITERIISIPYITNFLKGRSALLPPLDNRLFRWLHAHTARILKTPIEEQFETLRKNFYQDREALKNAHFYFEYLLGAHWNNYIINDWINRLIKTAKRPTNVGKNSDIRYIQFMFGEENLHTELVKIKLLLTKKKKEKDPKQKRILQTKIEESKDGWLQTLETILSRNPYHHTAFDLQMTLLGKTEFRKKLKEILQMAETDVTEEGEEEEEEEEISPTTAANTRRRTAIIRKLRLFQKWCIKIGRYDLATTCCEHILQLDALDPAFKDLNNILKLMHEQQKTFKIVEFEIAQDPSAVGNKAYLIPCDKGITTHLSEFDSIEIQIPWHNGKPLPIDSKKRRHTKIRMPLGQALTHKKAIYRQHAEQYLRNNFKFAFNSGCALARSNRLPAARRCFECLLIQMNEPANNPDTILDNKIKISVLYNLGKLYATIGQTKNDVHLLKRSQEFYDKACKQYRDIKKDINSPFILIEFPDVKTLFYLDPKHHLWWREQAKEKLQELKEQYETRRSSKRKTSQSDKPAKSPPPKKAQQPTTTQTINNILRADLTRVNRYGPHRTICLKKHRIEMGSFCPRQSG